MPQTDMMPENASTPRVGQESDICGQPVLFSASKLRRSILVLMSTRQTTGETTTRPATAPVTAARNILSYAQITFIRQKLTADFPFQFRSSMSLHVVLLVPTAVLPARATAGSAGYDLTASHDATIPARGRALVRTGLAFASIPDGTYGRIAPRSGLALKKGLCVGAGVVDADYRGEVGVVLFNHSDVDVDVAAGDRCAQIVFERIFLPDVVQVAAPDGTPAAGERGTAGFGSTDAPKCGSCSGPIHPRGSDRAEFNCLACCRPYHGRCIGDNERRCPRCQVPWGSTF